MEFKLEEDQIKRLQEWKDTIKKRYGKYGLYEYRFIPTGIGCSVKVFSLTSRKTLDLSDVEKW